MGVTTLISINYRASIQHSIFFSELNAENKLAFSIAFRKMKYPGSDFPKILTSRQKAGSGNETFQPKKTVAN